MCCTGVKDSGVERVGFLEVVILEQILKQRAGPSWAKWGRWVWREERMVRTCGCRNRGPGCPVRGRVEKLAT